MPLSWRDGRTLLAVRGDGILWLVPLDGPTPSKAIELSDSLALVGPARWAPDGQTIYLRGRRRSDGMGCFLAVVPGGSPRVLVWFDDPLRPSYRPEWSTDGRRFFFAIGDRQADVYVAEIR